MPTTTYLRPLLDRKNWEPCGPLAVATGQGHIFLATPPWWPVPHVLNHTPGTGNYLYDPKQDSWGMVSSANDPGAILAVGACGAFHPVGPTGTASAGAASTITTAFTSIGDLAGYTLRLTGGTGAGQVRTISFNTVGVNAVLTVSTPWSVNPDNTTTYTLMTGRFWFLNCTGSAVTWKYYDVASNTWVTKSVTSGPGSTFGTDGYGESTAGILAATSLASGTATAGAASTLTNAAKAWATNQWANSQVRLTGGTGAGQVRTINSNTGTDLTVSAVWSVNPDATSTYVIEGNDDWIYIIGNAAVTMFRYAINGIAGLSSDAQATSDTWITLAPTAARSGAPQQGASLLWISDSPDARFNTENMIVNGRRLYSYRGSGSTAIDYYDIAAHTWVSDITLQRGGLGGAQQGSSYAKHLGIIYFHTASGKYTKFNTATSTIDPLTTLVYAQGSAMNGQGKSFLFSYIDGSTEILWLYNLRNSGTELFRMMLI